jgi:outer membrane protein OmpU
MNLRKTLLGSTAALGAGMMSLTAAMPATAAEVKAGGYPDITITGFLRAEAFGGEQADAKANRDLSDKLDFRNDTEVHVLARAKSEQTGLEYGATIEFEADTNNTANTDETWIFLRGGWGEMRMGDEDGVVDNSIVGGQTIAAGTGGIDGSDAVITAAPLVFPTNSNDATKIRYYTPSFGGFSLGVSYTPTQSDFDSGANNGQNRASKDGANAMDAKNIFEGAAVYDGDFGGVGILASVVGLYGTLRNDAEATFGDSDWWNVTGGLVVDLFGFKLAGSVGQDNPGDARRNWFTAGIGYGFGPVNTSLTYAQIFDSNNDFEEATGFSKPNNLVFSADYALAPGLVLAGDVGVFDNDYSGDFDDGGLGEKGWQAVGRFAVNF